MSRSRRQFWILSAAILAAVYLMAFFGAWIGAAISFLGTEFFIAQLLVWFVPGVLFEWTGLFEYHEFGASPVGFGGYAVMFLFYAAVAMGLSWLVLLLARVIGRGTRDR